MKEININVFKSLLSIMILFLVPSFLAAWAQDEGTLGTSLIWHAFARLFTVLRFPTHTIFWKVISLSDSGLLFLGGLIFNCCFWSLSIERVITLVIKRKAKIEQTGNNKKSPHKQANF